MKAPGSPSNSRSDVGQGDVAFVADITDQHGSLDPLAAGGSTVASVSTIALSPHPIQPLPSPCAPINPVILATLIPDRAGPKMTGAPESHSSAQAGRAMALPEQAATTGGPGTWPRISRLKESLPAITERIVETYEECGAIHHLGHSPLPSYREVVEILADLREILYPGYGRRQNLHMGNVAYHVGDLIDSLHDRLTQQIARAFRHNCRARDLETDFEARAQEIVIQFLESLPDAAQAAHRGRPGGLRRRPGRQEPRRDRLLLSGPGGDLGLSPGPRPLGARGAR